MSKKEMEELGSQFPEIWDIEGNEARAIHMHNREAVILLHAEHTLRQTGRYDAAKAIDALGRAALYDRELFAMMCTVIVSLDRNSCFPKLFANEKPE